MKWHAAVAIIAGILPVVLASDVIDLNENNFKDEILQEDLALVDLAPHYEEAASELKGKKNIKLAKVDCTAEQTLCSEYGVNGYPTLKVFRNGSPTDYAGPRKADGIISYMIKQSLPAVSDVTLDSHADFIKADKVVLVAYGDSSHPIPQVFDDYANIARDSYLFGRYTGSPLPVLPGSPVLPAVILHKSFDEGFAVFPSDELSSATGDSLAEFVKLNSVPLMDEISPENFGMYAEQGLPIAYLFVDPEDLPTRDILIDAIVPLAKELKGKINFVYIDAVKFVDHGKSLNLPGDVWPSFVVQDLAQQTKYPLTGKVTKESVEQFMRSFIDGEIAPSIKSQSAPATQDHPVYKLTANGWDSLFGDLQKDIFAEFYAPWCGHCQRLAPIWDTLAERYEDDPNIVIAQMDATENDVPPQAPFRVQGFPTLKFRPAGGNDFVDYGGDRSLESLVEFVEQSRKSTGRAGVTEEEEEEEWADEEAVSHDEL
ncbi:protein disulfide-isomerase domain [Tremella mesenterica]|uniref:protein disulfide-isomerase n=1 Tax=Tremella mesenterica TaxID=5217 RepID=A0A4Q1BM65_TREME|nr:protein disulfide-isomerase domain [Tremella mesenterica]